MLHRHLFGPFVHLCCCEKGERGTGLVRLTAGAPSREDTGMDFITKMFARVQNWGKGQTMTEYALIMAAVAVVVYVG